MSNLKKQWQEAIDEIDPGTGGCTLIYDDVLLWAENRIVKLESLLERAVNRIDDIDLSDEIRSALDE